MALCLASYNLSMISWDVLDPSVRIRLLAASNVGWRASIPWFRKNGVFYTNRWKEVLYENITGAK